MQNRILIVDDAELNRDLLRTILEDTYEIVEAENGRQAVEILMRSWNKIDALLLDLHMPEMNGFEVMVHMRQNNWLKKIPVLVITGENAIEVENRCFELGVSDFIPKPFDASIIRYRIKNIVELFTYRNSLETQVEKQTATLKSQYQILNMQAAKLQEGNDKIVEILGTVVEFRNMESGEHVQRVKGFTGILARQMMKQYPEYGLTEKKIHEIMVASSLHDIGKITIPDKILMKPGKLTQEEFEFMKSHTTRGCDMLNTIENIWTDEYRKTCYEICRHHHERYDGKGYPDGLKGDEIPIAAQIVSVADVYDALVSERIYKNAYTMEEAYHMILTGECGVFSPKLMECFRQVRTEFENLATKLQ